MDSLSSLAPLKVRREMKATRDGNEQKIHLQIFATSILHGLLRSFDTTMMSNLIVMSELMIALKFSISCKHDVNITVFAVT